MAGRVARGPLAPGGRYRPLHARPAPYASVPYWPRSGGGLPHRYRDRPSGYWGTRSKPWPASTRPWRWRTSCRILIVWRLRGFGRPGVCSSPGRAGRARAGRGHCRALDRAGLSTHWAAMGTSLRGWALAMQGQGEEGIAQVRQGIAAWRATGAALWRPILVHLAGGSL